MPIDLSDIDLTQALKNKQKLIDLIIRRVRTESPFVEKSDYTIETMRRILEEEL